ncbi:PLP-dependent aminotransferase family protein [Niveibacterium sp. COAC-50]|uniref:MocR-like pyridoxine biosynthesis transcription factor PdxR n=1 Tax=Niveibacterium sp. COAC-50 TaxID=2729384 RepID=UPI001554FD12|nr:PLP-dependent aminotransferase family protein [Niveibacterium sp. COAC-50]
MLLLNLDRASAVPLYLQIAQQLAARIDAGALAAGEALSPTRLLAQRLGVNRSTVCRAYAQLQASGHVESCAGGYTRVRARAAATDAARTSDGHFDWGSRVRSATSPARSVQAVGDGIDFRPLAPDPRLAPVHALRRAMKLALADDTAGLLDYPSPLGHLPLRQWIAERMAHLGAPVTADSVMLCNGAQHGLDLVFRTLLAPGANVAVEAPGYACANALIAQHGANPIGVPMRDDGLDLAALAAVIAQHRPTALYTMPNFQNPTGITTPIAHREQLMRLCEAHALPIIEDGFAEDMKYFGRAVPPLKALDRQGLVIHVGTFSKLLFPGLRVGWIAASPTLIAALAATRSTADLGGSALPAAALWQLCASGEFDRHLRRLHTEYRRRMQRLIRATRTWLTSERVRCSMPQGGYVCWVEVDGGQAGTHADEAELIAALAAAGVRVTPGAGCYPAGHTPARTAFRLSIAQVDEAAIERGVQRIGEVLRARRP